MRALPTFFGCRAPPDCPKKNRRLGVARIANRSRSPMVGEVQAFFGASHGQERLMTVTLQDPVENSEQTPAALVVLPVTFPVTLYPKVTTETARLAQDFARSTAKSAS